MRKMQARARALILGGVAAGGVLASHWIGYRAAVPDHHHVGHVLESTGHDAFGYVAAGALGLFVAALALFISGRLHEGDERVDRRRLFAFALIRLLPLGVGAFVGLEALERALFVDHGPALFEQAPVLFGIAAQIVVALLGALLLVLISAVVEAIGRARRRQPSSSQARVGAPRSVLLVGRAAIGGCGGRAPPAPSF